MTKTIKSIAKGGIATIAAGAMAFGAASPAYAQDHRDNDRDGISVGEIIAGAVIIGGIAAIASSGNRDRGYDYRGNGQYYGNSGYNGYNGNNGYNRYDNRGNPRAAVERCVAAVRQDAQRSGYRNAQVTEIRDVRDTRQGWRVKGRIMVNAGYQGGRYNQNGYYDRYGRYHQWNNNNNSSDSGNFTCDVERGRVNDVDYNGLRRMG